MQVENKSGIYPVGYRVLVKPVEINPVTDGGIHIPDEAREKMEFAQQYGEMTAWGDGAFCTTEFSEEERDRLRKIGQPVMMTKYGGKRLRGSDREWYFLCNDKDITAAVDKIGSKGE